MPSHFAACMAQWREGKARQKTKAEWELTFMSHYFRSDWKQFKPKSDSRKYHMQIIKTNHFAGCLCSLASTHGPCFYKLPGTSWHLIFSGATLFSFLHVNRYSCVSLSGNLWLSFISSGWNQNISARHFWNISLMDGRGGGHPLQGVLCQVLHWPGVCRWN